MHEMQSGTFHIEMTSLTLKPNWPPDQPRSRGITK